MKVGIPATARACLFGGALMATGCGDDLDEASEEVQQQGEEAAEEVQEETEEAADD